MNNKLIIADDELAFSSNLFNYLKANNNVIDIVGIALDGKQTLNLIENLNPDILLLDLQMPKINGIKILESIEDREISVILISGQAEMINTIQIKSFKLIKQIYINPFDFEKLNMDLKYFCEKESISEIRQNIENELLNFSFNKGSIGYMYLIECLAYSYENVNLLENMEKRLFTIVAKKFKIDNPKIIKWSIQKAIASMSRYTPTNILHQYFPYTKNPTTKTFITTINDILIKKYKF